MASALRSRTFHPFHLERGALSVTGRANTVVALRRDDAARDE